MRAKALPLANPKPHPARSGFSRAGVEAPTKSSTRRGSRRRFQRKPSGSTTRKDRNQWGSPARAGQSEEERDRQQVQAVLGMRISAMRRVKGWPQDALARRSGISPATLGQIERGHQDFHIRSLVSIAKGLETTVADLLMGIA